MSSDEGGDKSEAPTDHRRMDAREKGNVARSADLNSAFMMLAASAVLMTFGPAMGTTMARLLQAELSRAPTFELDARGASQSMWVMAMGFATTLLPMMLLMMLAAVVVNLMQIGFLFTTEPLQLKWDRLNPVTGFQRLFSMQAIIKLGISLAKLVILSVLIYIFALYRLPGYEGLMQATPGTALAATGQLCIELSFTIAACLMVLALGDVAWQRFDHEQKLMMTKQEVRDEMKNMEGDPFLRMRRREAHRKLAMAKEMAAVPKADVIITNPTHISVAIKYDAKIHPAPIVVAKGAGEIALRIRELAREHRVPIIERKPLARALFKTVKVGHAVPVEMYDVFVEIMSYVYKLSGKQLPADNASGDSRQKPRRGLS